MKKNLMLAVLAIAGSAHAYEAKVMKGELPATLDALLNKASTETGVAFDRKNFMLIESRNLATSKYDFYVQTNSMIPVAKTAVRIYSDLKTGELVYANMSLDEKAKADEAQLRAKYAKARFSPGAIKSQQLSKAITQIVTTEVSGHATDARIISMKSKDQWENGDLVRVVEVRARRGVHTVKVSLLKNRIVSRDYTEFPQAERVTLKANIFPIYEEVEGTGQLLPYEVKELRYVDAQIRDGGNDPLGTMTGVSFPESRYFPLLAGTELGEMYGLWSEASVRAKVEAITSQLPLRANSFENGLLLSGKYATINLHPAAKEAFKDIDFDLVPTTNSMLSWKIVDGAYEGAPLAGLAGKPITSQADLLARIPFRHPENDATAYINSGVDEAQVYYAVTVLMESLIEMGFTDKELSEKPFHAFLFDPDLGMQNNAYYTDNTINFTTYTKENPNLARDNATIWHELGHAVMERLMGAHLAFEGGGGYGGLSEGIADFVASIVVEHQTDGTTFPGKENFRIINETGYYLTNEFHDEGEAYGGALNDMLMTAISYEGKAGLVAFTDLTIEAMRLTRNHPALSASGWFEHMLIADSLGSSVRAPGKFKTIIEDALKLRNFSFESGFKAASMTVTYDDTVLTDKSPASREKPLTPCANEGLVSYDLKVKLTGGDSNFIKFPATVKVEYKKGALQGAIKWVGEEINPQVYTINSAEEVLNLPIKASMECDSVNQPDGSCKDYAYIQVWNGGTKPIAKKRFYLKLNKAECAE
jgi:hypothetical protein